MSILTHPENKFDFFNVRFPDIERFGENQLKAFWMPSDVSYANDGKTFETLDAKTRKMVEMTIGFFFSSDGIVFDNLGSNFKEEIKTPEAQYTYSAIETIELIHAKSYGRQLDSIIQDPTEKMRLMNAITEIPAIRDMANWASEYTDRNKYNLLDRLIAFLCVEGIFFSSPFAFIFWIRKYHPGKVEGIVAANDLISRDENLHCEFAVHIINTLQKEGMTSNRASSIMMSAVDVSLNFVRDTLTDDFLDMNVELMTRHVKSVANRWATMIGLPLLYPDCKVTPFKFMENISLEVKKNFFEHTATEYQKAPPMAIDFSNNNDDTEW